MSVNPIKLIINDRLEFSNTTKKLHEDSIQKGKDVDLVELWEKRRLSVDNKI